MSSSLQTDASYWSRSLADTAAALQTDPVRGLGETEAAARLDRVGPNRLKGKEKKGLVGRFLNQFRSFMILVLMVAAVVAGVLGHSQGEGITDALIILAIVLVNACIGTVQESRAENALAALEEMAAPHCRVIRDGVTRQEDVARLVPGDVVVLEAGDLVPADLRLAEAVALKVQEASLTGESVPVEKSTEALAGDVPVGDRTNMAHATGVVVSGRGRGMVTATGMATETGRIASLLESIDNTRSPLQIRIDRLGRMLGLGALTVCVAVFVLGVAQGREVAGMFLIAVSLAVAAIPEGLPAVTTVVLAVGMQRLAAQKAIVRNLPSVETLGSTTVICSDKTGTLTQNRMTVTRLYIDGQVTDLPKTLNGPERETIRTAVLANDAKGAAGEAKALGDPTETALLDLGERYGIRKEELDGARPRKAELAFDSERKMMSTVHAEESGLRVRVKGGPDEVLVRCERILTGDGVRPLDEADRERIREANTAMASSALRVLAAAYRDLQELPPRLDSASLEQGLVFCGLLGMIDPPRQEAGDAVADCREAGIRPVMITGDHLATAVAIAGELGIHQEGDRALTGTELESMSDTDLARDAALVSVYARVAPEQKVRIVKALQEEGEVVAMTGDGVNDAPALKLADIGVAMGVTGTDVSRQAADLVLADDNFATIVTAVREGRRIYDNVLKAVQFLVTTNVGEILVITSAIAVGWPTALLPVQILWINLVTDSLPALALGVDPAARDVMQRKPTAAKVQILNRPFLWRVLLQGGLIAALSLTAFRLGMSGGEDQARTMAFAVLGFSQIAQAFNVRTALSSALPVMFTNRVLLLAVGCVLGLMLGALCIPVLQGVFHVVPLSSSQWLTVGIFSFLPLPVAEAAKALMRLRRKNG